MAVVREGLIDHTTPLRGIRRIPITRRLMSKDGKSSVIIVFSTNPLGGV